MLVRSLTITDGKLYVDLDWMQKEVEVISLCWKETEGAKPLVTYHSVKGSVSSCPHFFYSSLILWHAGMLHGGTGQEPFVPVFTDIEGLSKAQILLTLEYPFNPSFWALGGLGTSALPVCSTWPKASPNLTRHHTHTYVKRTDNC